MRQPANMPLVTYLRMADNGCSFVMGKTRLATLKENNVPRLELQAATFGKISSYEGNWPSNRVSSHV